jgi:lysylphosphatidylglycerol synthetase-like protein (DUF2156 family)
MKKFPFTVSITLLFLTLNALVWLGFTALVALNLHPALPDQITVRWIMGILAFGSAGALIVLIILLGKRIRIAYFLTLGMLALLAVLTITDEVGWVDLLYLAIVVVPLILLIKDRVWYLAPTAGSSRQP